MSSVRFGKRSRWVPAGSTAIERPDLPAVVYVYGNLCAIAYGGNRIKADWNYRFPSEKQMQQHIAQYFANMEAHKRFCAERKAEREAYEHDYQVGDILNGSWGWEQTNQEFYQVVRVLSRKTIVVRAIAHRYTDTGTGNSMAAYCVPVKDQFVGPEMVRQVRPGGYINGDCSSVVADRWDGRECYESWYA